jgi:hypothetical protein
MRYLAKIALDLWLLTQRPDGGGLPDGHQFQHAVADALRRPGINSVQRAGLHTLWCATSASGVGHEIDAAARAKAQAYLVEAKATNGISKADLAVFELKVTDYYFRCWRTVAEHAWYPLLVAAGSVSNASRRLAVHRAITLCDHARLPLPVLFHHASHPSTRNQLPEDLCTEMTRLAPRALACLQERYMPCTQYNGVILRPSSYTPDEIDDLLYVQDELTDNILDRYDRLAPGRLEARAMRLQRRIRCSGFRSQDAIDLNQRSLNGLP